jgi:hypothetical protein
MIRRVQGVEKRYNDLDASQIPQTSSKPSAMSYQTPDFRPVTPNTLQALDGVTWGAPSLDDVQEFRLQPILINNRLVDFWCDTLSPRPSDQERHSLFMDTGLLFEQLLQFSQSVTEALNQVSVNVVMQNDG